LLDLRGIVPFTDYFVICSATSDRMLKALMHAALDKVREDHQLKTQVEGEALDGWLLADFGDVVLHLFSAEQRQYYDLEALWGEGKVLLHVQ
jgi:ribosome-associated protein